MHMDWLYVSKVGCVLVCVCSDRVMWPELEEVGGQDGRGKEPQEDETADSRVPDVLVH